jgi:hypothetical protein
MKPAVCHKKLKIVIERERGWTMFCEIRYGQTAKIKEDFLVKVQDVTSNYTIPS